jgi:hypothetical protein
VWSLVTVTAETLFAFRTGSKTKIVIRTGVVSANGAYVKLASACLADGILAGSTSFDASTVVAVDILAMLTKIEHVAKIKA